MLSPPICWSITKSERMSGSTYGYDSYIWSLGLTLLEFALGRFPYQLCGKDGAFLSFYELLETIVGQPPPTASSNEFSSEFCFFVSAWLKSVDWGTSIAVVSEFNLNMYKYVAETEGSMLSMNSLQKTAYRRTRDTGHLLLISLLTIIPFHICDHPEKSENHPFVQKYYEDEYTLATLLPPFKPLA